MHYLKKNIDDILYIFHWNLRINVISYTIYKGKMQPTSKKYIFLKIKKIQNVLTFSKYVKKMSLTLMDVKELEWKPALGYI